ncbi:MAG: glycosyltransferase [Saprospiraceae bacterium]|nr:glycosyltransferase [Saprospiraceae bacterium]
MKKLKLAIVTPYPPGKGTLNEYAFHLVEHFKNKPQVEEICIICEDLEDNSVYPNVEGKAKVSFKPVWAFNKLSNIFNIYRAIKISKVDMVLLNIHFLSFGDKKVAAALGLLLPMLLKLSGIKSVVLLHNIIESVDLDAAGITKNRILQNIFSFIGTMLTRMILTSDLVAVTISKYVEILNAKYKTNNVALIPHGTFDLPETPDFESSKNEKTIMTFGKFGTYKTVEPLIEAVDAARAKTDIKLKLIIAGTDNPNRLGYLDKVQSDYAHIEDIEFTGYVEEEDVPKVFLDSDIVVFPYTSTTGSSGVLHQAGSYGKACVIPNIGDLKALIEEEGYVGEYFKPDSAEGLEKAILQLVHDDALRINNAQQNFYASRGLPMSDITDWYLIHFSRILMNTDYEVKNEKEPVKINRVEFISASI